MISAPVDKNMSPQCTGSHLSIQQQHRLVAEGRGYKRVVRPMDFLPNLDDPHIQWLGLSENALQ